MPADTRGDDAITLWTAQASIVWEIIQRDGVSRVRTEYIERKYQEVAWSFREAYSFFREHAANIVAPPAGAESGIWLYADSRWAYTSPGSYLLELEVPRSACILFDLRCWDRVINLRYLAADDAEERAFEAELARQGITRPADVFAKPFYPALRQRVRKSWERLFTSAEGCPWTYIEAGVWELRREWVRTSTLL